MEPNNFFLLAENSIAFQTFLIVVSAPVFCALCISLFHRFIFGKEFFSIFSSLVVVFFNFSLVLSFLEGNSFNFELIEVFPKVGLSFYWPSLERQIIIKGEAEKLSAEKSDQYFDSRPRGSQLGAHVSPQSEVISNRKFLEDLQASLEEKFENTEIPRPDHWGGILVRPQEIEFWQGRPNRLHDRICCYLDGIDWKTKRLAP